MQPTAKMPPILVELFQRLRLGWVLSGLMIPLIFLSGCYCMPGENDIPTVPLTNNASIIGSASQQITPGVPY